MGATSSPSLSQAVIVEEALRIADTEGLGAVSMRRLGGELGYSGMSLYGYVASKDELLGLLVDHVLGTVPAIDEDAPWDLGVVAFFGALHAALLRHPAVARLATERPTQGEHTQRHETLVLARLRASGMSGALATEVFVALSCYTLGAAMYAAGRASVAHGDRRATRTSPAQFRSGLEHLVRGYAR